MEKGSGFHISWDGTVPRHTWGAIHQHGKALGVHELCDVAWPYNESSGHLPAVSTWTRFVDQLIRATGALPIPLFSRSYIGLVDVTRPARPQLNAELLVDFLRAVGVGGIVLALDPHKGSAGAARYLALEAACTDLLTLTGKVAKDEGGRRPTSYKRYIALCDELLEAAADFQSVYSYDDELRTKSVRLDVAVSDRRNALIGDLLKAAGRVQETARRHGLRIPQVVDPELLAAAREPALNWNGDRFLRVGQGQFKSAPGGPGERAIMGLKEVGMADRPLGPAGLRVAFSAKKGAGGFLQLTVLTASGSSKAVDTPLSTEALKALAVFGITQP